MSQAAPAFDKAVIVRRALFFVVLLALTLIHLLILFRGLDSPQAMDQAQIGRQIARGEGFTTQFIRPLELHLAERGGESNVALASLHDTYHAPLNPLVLGAVLKLVSADDAEKWQMGAKELIYPLDRVVALVSTLFFLMAMGVTYLLVSRIFDARIAGVTAILMLLCDLMWRFSLSGLPQMLLLLLFSCGLYFAYRTVEAQEEGRTSLVLPIIAAVFFSLMVLAHWITVWIFIGYIIFAGLAFKPRGVVALFSLGVLALFVAYPVFRMIDLTGQPLGAARFVFYNGLANGSEAAVMRTLDLGDTPLNIDGLLLKILGTTLVQASDLVPFLGGIIAAPLFFVALLHPFRRASISRFRWLLALMWLFAALGMAVFGVARDRELHPNQIHILFAPIMAAYGLALLTILWSKLPVVATNPFLRHAHHFVIVALSAAPLLLSLPRAVSLYMNVVDKGGFPQWPPYYPPLLNLGLSRWVDRDPTQPEIVVSDQPWAVAWYADVPSIWLPRSKEDLLSLDARASDQGTPFAGILVTPSSRDSGASIGIQGEYGNLAPLIFDGRVASVTGPSASQPGVSIYQQAPMISEIARRFPYRTPLLLQEIVYYSDREIRPSN